MRNQNITLTEAQKAELAALAAMPEDQIDLSDIPETLDWSNARRGRFYSPVNRRAQPLAPKPPPTPTDTSERGLEDRIFATMIGGGDVEEDRSMPDRPAIYGASWLPGHPDQYDREFCVDLTHLSEFIVQTQLDTAKGLSLDKGEIDYTARRFLSRLKDQIGARGVIDVLRNGVWHDAHNVKLYYPTPTPGNVAAAEQYRRNRFSITRQLRYSRDNKQLALDLALFVNGLPVATFELKNSLTKQTVSDAVEQYKNDRDPREDLFKLGRCIAHFAVDENEARFCTELTGKDSWFLPFNKGWNNGAGNPPNPNGLKTDYLWREVLTRDSLANVIENYAQLLIMTDRDTGRKRRTQIWPRYHQLDAVRKLLNDAGEKGAGQKYLIQHSAGSGKSNSIAWLAHQLIGLKKDDRPVFDSIIVVTNRIILDSQIYETIRNFTQLHSTVAHAENANSLRHLIQEGKQIIISTVQKFPFILDEIGNEHLDRRFAIIIDEAHSGYGGAATTKMSQALGGATDDDEVTPNTFEDRINELIESRKLLANASYFAFTATPKNKTLELFGTPDPQANGVVRHLPFHSYTMKQAIDEGFILDVLSSYTPYGSYYNLVKSVEEDPKFDSRRSQSKLRRYVEQHPTSINRKARIMVEHFHDSVIAPGKMNRQARAMVVVNGVNRALDYYRAISKRLGERNSPYKALVAFAGKREYRGATVSESSLNGFSEHLTAGRFREDPYRFLICADKFQTGYDEPLLHTMYVDKTLAGIQAVQTLSRLNRSHPSKSDVFVLDFSNSIDVIENSFADYYQTTILSGETDPNKLHDLKASLDGYPVYDESQIDDFTRRFLEGEDRGRLDPTLDGCVASYRKLDVDGQVAFKGNAKAFLRTYAFLAQILAYGLPEWEKLSIFLTFLTPKLPSPEDEDPTRGLLETVDIESYRVEKRETQKIILPNKPGVIDPAPIGRTHLQREFQLDPVSRIIEEFNSAWGTDWTDADLVRKLIADIPGKVSKDQAYVNARANAGEENARIEHDAVLERVIGDMLKCSTELFKRYHDNPDGFGEALREMSFNATYHHGSSSSAPRMN